MYIRWCDVFGVPIEILLLRVSALTLTQRMAHTEALRQWWTWCVRVGANIALTCTRVDRVCVHARTDGPDGVIIRLSRSPHNT